MAPSSQNLRRVAVLGDHLLDAYVRGTVSRVCPDAPAPVLDWEQELFACGGAANVAVGCSARALEVVACGFIGADRPARVLETLLAESGVRLDGLLAIKGRSTLVKRRFCSGDHVLLRVDEGSATQVDARRTERLRPLLTDLDALVVSDYGYGSVTEELRDHIAQHPRRGHLLLIDAKNLSLYRNTRPDVVKPNYAQAISLLGQEPRADRVAQIIGAADSLLSLTGSKSVVVTLDADGCVVVTSRRTTHIAAPYIDVASTSGAGDTFMVALTDAMLSGHTLLQAARMATTAATHACRGNLTISASFAPGEFTGGRDKRVPPAEVAQWAQSMREQGKRVVLTNGCFDIFHAGHAEFLQRASEAGDALLVAVNTDESVRRLKGSERPVNALEDRARVLESIGVVSAVTWFDDENAQGVVAVAKPDVYVKGSDYQGLTFPEAEYVRRYGGQVLFVDLLEGRSTTGIVEKVRQQSEVAV